MKIRTERTIAVAHYLPDYNGPCQNLHGHNIRVVVEVEGELDNETHMIVDFAAIKSIINQYDHRCLNDFGLYPTAEELAIKIAREVKELGSKIEYVKVRVYESKDSYAEYVCANS
ncbi:MAG TPA: 6-carboxytetrahydropterin synthase [Methanofastidiosum sp.]|nr:6-carboxytetrahydropterin synthase [Methanofastidiosum sp.]